MIKLSLDEVERNVIGSSASATIPGHGRRTLDPSKAKVPVRVARPGELLFEFCRERDHKFFRCELRDYGKWGVEAQFFEGGDFIIGQRFEDVSDGERIVTAREFAIAWANAERRFVETGVDD
jgi:hypothetical protein